MRISLVLDSMSSLVVNIQDNAALIVNEGNNIVADSFLIFSRKCVEKLTREFCHIKF